MDTLGIRDSFISSDDIGVFQESTRKGQLGTRMVGSLLVMRIKKRYLIKKKRQGLEGYLVHHV